MSDVMAPVTTRDRFGPSPGAFSSRRARDAMGQRFGRLARVGVGLTMSLVSAVAPAAPPADGLARCVATATEQAGFSGAVRVSHQGVVVADLARGELAEPGSGRIGRDTRFNIGSATKMFTAVAIGQLIEQGKIQLDEPVGRIVDGLSPEVGQVTIRQLLDHTSGLGGTFITPETVERMARARSAGDLLPLIKEDTLAYAPGTGAGYSNTGFLLLGVVVERASGLDYWEYLRRHIFAPAGMTGSGRDARPLATLAVGMTNQMLTSPPPGRGLVLVRPDDHGPASPATPATPATLRPAPGAREGYGSAAGGSFSTAADMDRFASALETGKLLSRPTFDRFTSPQSRLPGPNGAPARDYGFGFGIGPEAGRTWVGHNGGAPGASAEFWFDPLDQWTVTVLSNRDPPAATLLKRRIQSLLGPQGAPDCP